MSKHKTWTTSHRYPSWRNQLYHAIHYRLIKRRIQINIALAQHRRDPERTARRLAIATSALAAIYMVGILAAAIFWPIIHTIFTGGHP